MSAHLRYAKLASIRAIARTAREGYFYNGSPKKSIVFKPAKDTKGSSLLTYIRRQKTTRLKRVKVTLPKISLEK